MKKIIMILAILLGLTGLVGCNSKTTPIKNMMNAESAIVSDGDRVVYDFAIEANRQFKLAYDFKYISDYKTCLVVGTYDIQAKDKVNNYTTCFASYDIFIVQDNGHIKINRYALCINTSYSNTNSYKLDFCHDIQFDYIGQDDIGSSMFWNSSWIDASLNDVIKEYSKFDIFNDFIDSNTNTCQYSLQGVIID